MSSIISLGSSGMSLVISLLLVACIIFLGLFTFNLRKKDNFQLGRPIFIILLVLIFLIFLLSVYFIFDNSDTKFSDYRYFFIGVSSVLAFFSLLISSFWSTQTIKLTQQTQQINLDSQKITMDNQKISLVMDMIKNNYQLLKDKEEGINVLINDLDSVYSGKSFFFNKVAKIFHERLRENEASFDFTPIDSYRQMVLDKRQRLARAAAKAGQPIPPNNNKIDLLRDFKQIFKDNKEDVSFKILVTYFSANEQSTSNVFSLLNSSIQKKIYNNKAHLSFLNETYDLDNFIKNFLEEEEIKSILERDGSTLTHDEIMPEMEKTFNNHYNELGHFFRNSYRVVKFINLFSDTHFKADPSFRRTYLGVLRSYYSENVLLAIYYNSTFTKKGLGYAKELAKSDFFGDANDLSSHEPMHIRKDKLYFGSRDFRLIEGIFISNSSFVTDEVDEIKIKECFDV